MGITFISYLILYNIKQDNKSLSFKYMDLFSKKSGYIGVDVGSSSVKMVQLEKKSGKIKLVTYGYSENKKEIGDGSWTKNVDFVANVIDKTYKEMEGTSEKAVASLPAFSVFSSIINLSNVEKKDLAQAINWEAKKFIPIPLEEMILDWKIVDKGTDKKNTKVFLTGSPKKLVKRYVSVFRKTIVNLASLETETFSLIRSLIGADKSTVMIVEIGANTTDISIVKEGIPALNRSLDVGGKTITKTISNSLNIGLDRAEQFKQDLGVSGFQGTGNVIPATIASAINPIVNEVKYLLNLFQSKGTDKVEKIILSGGSATLPNIVDYLSEKLNMNVIIGDPWARIAYPKQLEPILKELGPSFSAAIGSAMREME